MWQNIKDVGGIKDYWWSETDAQIIARLRDKTKGRYAILL